jgi:translation initiation factor 1
MARERETRLAYSTSGPASPEEPENTAPAPASGKGIRLGLDRRASGRVVTVVTGLPGRPRDVEELGKALRSACGAGGTVKDGVLELQGDHRSRVEVFLQSRGLRCKRSGG